MIRQQERDHWLFCEISLRGHLPGGMNMEGPVTQFLEEAWSEILFVDSPSYDDNFFELGGDSLSAIDLLERVENSYRIEFPLELLFTSGQFGDIANECESRVRSRSDMLHENPS